MIKIYSYFFLFLLIILSCNKDEACPKIIEGQAFGSYFKIQYYGEKDFQKEIASLFEEMDQSLSSYRTDSELSKWNAGNDSLSLSPYFIEIAEVAKIIYEESDGYYDPTVKTLVEGWGFGNGIPTASLNPNEVDSLLQFVGYNKLTINHENSTIIKKDPRIQIEFNSVAPGFIADKVAELFKSNQIENFLIDIGGEIYGNGKNLEENKNWLVGIEDPTREIDNRSYLKTVELQNKALATSGNYRKIKTDNLGNKIVHTINPKTGMPKVSNLLSATIITNHCANADAYATAAMAMGYPKAINFLKSYHLENFLVIEKNNSIEIIQVK